MKTPKKSPAKPTSKKAVEDNDDLDDDLEISKVDLKSVEEDDDFDLPLDDIDNFDFDDDDDDF
jgi:hypothetical protein